MRSIYKTPFKDLLPKNISWPIFIVLTLQFLQSSLLNAAFVVLLNSFLILRCLNADFKIYLIDRFRNYYWFLFFELWAVISISWSALPKITAHAVAIETAYFISIVLSIIYTIHYEKNLIKTLVLSSGFIILLIITYFLVSPGGSYLDGNLVSFYDSKNHLGTTLAVTLFILLFSDIKFKYKLICLGIGTTALILSQSKTSISGYLLTLIIVTIVYVIINKLDSSDSFLNAISRLFFKLLQFAAYGLVIGIFIYRVEIVNFIIHNLTDDLLTGRGKLWHSVLILARSNLEQGLGIAVMWGAERSSEIAQSRIYMHQWVRELTSADGGYIDLIGSLGFVGLTLLYFSFIQTYTNLIQMRKQEGFYLVLALITFIFIHNFTESHIYRFRDLLWSIFTYLYFYIAFNVNRSHVKSCSSHQKTIN